MAPKKQTPADEKPATPTAEPVVTEEPATTVPDVPDVTDELGSRLSAAIEALQAKINTEKEVLAVLKAVLKERAKLLKQRKDGKRQRRAAGGAADGTSKPSGFAKPTKLSTELCDFLGLPSDSMLARTEVTRQLNKYIKDNNLQDPADKRTIKPDGKLQKVLKMEKDAQLTYFNLQSHIKHHFSKVADVSA